MCFLISCFMVFGCIAVFLFWLFCTLQSNDIVLFAGKNN